MKLRYLWLPLLVGIALACARLGEGEAGGAGAAESKTTAPASRPVVAKWTPRAFAKDQVHLIAMGDWGSNGSEQKVVAEGLARYVESTGIQFNGLLSVGDNFYVGLKDENDYHFQSVFEDMYDARRINFPFYAALGNHDYERDKARAEINYCLKNPDSRWKMPARYYRVDLPAEKPIVTVLMLDSNKPKFSEAEWLAQMRWIEQQLSGPAVAKWTIACAHHPLFSNGAHGDNGVLQTNWGPIFQKYKLDFYICGHDHDLQHLEMPGWSTTFMLCGGGGKKPTKMRRDLRGPFSKSLNGFAHLRMFPDRAMIEYIDGETGRRVHQFERNASGKVEIVVKGGNDKASTQPLKVLLGLDEKTEAERKANGTPADP